MQHDSSYQNLVVRDIVCHHALCFGGMTLFKKLYPTPYDDGAPSKLFYLIPVDGLKHTGMRRGD